jgi:hypothetical protein
VPTTRPIDLAGDVLLGAHAPGEAGQDQAAADVGEVVARQQPLDRLQDGAAQRDQQPLREALLEPARELVEVLRTGVELGEQLVDRRDAGEAQTRTDQRQPTQGDQRRGDHQQRGTHSSTALTIWTMMKPPMPISRTARNSTAIPPPVSIGAK